MTSTLHTAFRIAIAAMICGLVATSNAARELASATGAVVDSERSSDGQRGVEYPLTDPALDATTREVVPTTGVDQVTAPAVPENAPSREPLGVTSLTPAQSAYSGRNPFIRTPLYDSRSSGDRFFDGLGGIPRLSDATLLPRARGEVYQFLLGPVKISPTRAPTLSLTKTFASPKTKDSRETQAQVSGGLTGELGLPESGRFLTLDYAASIALGSGGGNGSHLDQTASLRGRLDFVKLKLGLNISFDSLNGANREFDGDVERSLATISLTSSYVFSPKTSIDWDLSVPISDYKGGIGSSELTSTNFVNYTYSPKVSLGLGFTNGLLRVDQANTQTFHQVLGRVRSVANPFISYTATFGFERRETDGVSSTGPILRLGATWVPRSGTSFSADVEDRINNSAAIAGANYRTTSLTLTWAQRLWKDVNLGVSGGYEIAKYESASQSRTIGRQDDTAFAQASLSRIIFRHFLISGTVSYRHTASDEFPERATQITGAVSYVF